MLSKWSYHSFAFSKAILPFKEEFITKNILEQLISNKNNLIEVLIPQQPNDHLHNKDCYYIFKYGKASSSFVFVIKGKMTLEIGNEKIEHTVKPFDHFGIKALIGDCVDYQQVLNNEPTYKSYVPEYSLKIDYSSYWNDEPDNSNSLLVYLKIDRSTWLNAVKATQLKKSTEV